MATNPKVEKIQAVAVRHGEKAVVSVAVVLFLLFVVKAVTREAPIAFGPDALQKKAESADSNLSKRQDSSQILEALVAQGLKPETEFDKTVATQQSHALNPAEYVAKQKWVTPEPGAGLIRDQPELIAPEDLYAYPNRGGYLLFATNEKGDRIPDTGKDATRKRSGITPPRRRRGAMGMAMGGRGGSSMMGSGGGGGNSAKAREAAEKKRQEEEDRLRKAVAGDTKEAGTALKKDETKDAATPEANVAYKEVVKGLRSVVITGTLDNKRLRANYLNALKDPNLAYPNYKRLDVQRQTLGTDGTWSEFVDVDADRNLDILDNLTEIDDELVPDEARLEALVDPLPFPKAGYWTGVHVAGLVPKEKLEVKKAVGPVAGGSGGYMDQMAQMQARMSSQQGSQAAGGDAMGSRMMAQMQAQMSRGGGGIAGGGIAGRGGPMMAGAGGAGATGPADETDFAKSELDQVMIRSIDFTAEPDTTYRYRVRIVVVNPNLHHVNVNPGVDTESEELKGDFSEPTDPVTVPADVAAYALKKAAATRRDDQVTFQIVRWNPADGQTITRNDEAGPGELIGNYQMAMVPSSEGEGAKNKSIDFNSRRVVLDTMGGALPAPKPFGASAPFDEPALTLVLRPDTGTVALRAQPQDVTDPVRSEMEHNYNRAVKESTKKRRPRNMGMGMMGGRS